MEREAQLKASYNHSAKSDKNMGGRQGAILAFWVLLLLALTCYGHNEKVEVVGVVECLDCGNNNIKVIQVLSGLFVSIDCKIANGKFKTKGASKIDGKGNFRATLPYKELLTKEDNKLKKQCFAHLRSKFGAQCGGHDEEELSFSSKKIIFRTKSNGKITFSPSRKLEFSSTTCTSAFIWHFPTWPDFPPLTKGTPSPLYPPSPAPTPIYDNSIPPPISPPEIPFPSPQPAPIYYNNFIPPPPPPAPVLFNRPAPITTSNAPPTPKKSYPPIPRAPPIPSLPPIPSGSRSQLL